MGDIAALVDDTPLAPCGLERKAAIWPQLIDLVVVAVTNPALKPVFAIKDGTREHACHRFGRVAIIAIWAFLLGAAYHPKQPRLNGHFVVCIHVWVRQQHLPRGQQKLGDLTSGIRRRVRFAGQAERIRICKPTQVFDRILRIYWITRVEVLHGNTIHSFGKLLWFLRESRPSTCAVNHIWLELRQRWWLVSPASHR
nr:hypothetical protein [Roseobacter sp. CCS2]